MAGYDLDRYKDLEGVKGLRRVMERPHVVMTPIHREAADDEDEGPKPDKANIQFSFVVIGAAPAPEPEKKSGPANIERKMVVMTRAEPKPRKPATMSDIKL